MRSLDMKQLKNTQTRIKMSVTGMTNGINSEIIKINNKK